MTPQHHLAHRPLFRRFPTVWPRLDAAVRKFCQAVNRLTPAEFEFEQLDHKKVRYDAYRMVAADPTAVAFLTEQRRQQGGKGLQPSWASKLADVSEEEELADTFFSQLARAAALLPLERLLRDEASEEESSRALLALRPFIHHRMSQGRSKHLTEQERLDLVEATFERLVIGEDYATQVRETGASGLTVVDRAVDAVLKQHQRRRHHLPLESAHSVAVQPQRLRELFRDEFGLEVDDVDRWLRESDDNDEPLANALRDLFSKLKCASTEEEHCALRRGLRVLELQFGRG